MDVGALFRWMVRALRPMDIDVQFPPRKLNLRNSMNGLKSGSCRFCSGLIRNRVQKCCALKSSAPSGARQDNCADLLGLQTRRGSNHSAAHVGESNSRSNVIQITSRIRLRIQPLESSLGRVPQAADVTCNKISQNRSCRSPRTV